MQSHFRTTTPSQMMKSNVNSSMMVEDMLRAEFLMLKQGQQLFHSTNSAMSQQAKSLEAIEEKQARSLVVIEASHCEMKGAIKSLAKQVSAHLHPWEAKRHETGPKSLQRCL